MSSVEQESHLRVAIAALFPVDRQHVPGGVRSVALSLVQGLQNYSDLDIHVLHCHSEVVHDSDLSEGNVTLHYRAMPPRRFVPNTLVAVGRVKRMLQELAPDAVNAHSPHYAVAAMRAGLPTVLTVHGVPLREAPSYSHKGLPERLRFWMERYYAWLAMRQVRHAIAISGYVMREYAGKTQVQWHRIDNPLPDAFFQVPNQEQNDRVLYVGTLTEVKDVLTLVQAVACLAGRSDAPGCQLRLAGRTTSPAYERQLRAHVRDQGLEGKVHFLGMLDRQALLQEYAQCAVLALTSRQENAPMAIIEAMAAGKPVVATRVGGIPDVVEDGETGLLVGAGDVPGTAEALVHLLNNADLRRRMGLRARDVALSRFRLDQVAAKYRQVCYLVAEQAQKAV